MKNENNFNIFNNYKCNTWQKRDLHTKGDT